MHPILEAVILGITQGLTEFIPVSSSGHLILVDQWLQLNIGGFVLDAMLNIGTLAALLIYFRKDIAKMAKGILNGDNEQRKLGYYIVITALPAILAGFFLQDLADGPLRNVLVVAASLFIVGILMLLADKNSTDKLIKDIDVKTSLFMGSAQALALMPGVSRSGITIVAARSIGFSREASARFSFLMAIPILTGAVFKVLFSEGTVGLLSSNWHIFFVGNLASFASGYLAIDFLIKFLQAKALTPFAWYRIALASVITLSYMLGY